MVCNSCLLILVKSKELADTKQRLSEVTEKQADRSRQLQRLQVKC